MPDEEVGTEGPPMALKPKELEGWPPTVPGRGRGGASEPSDLCMLSMVATTFNLHLMISKFLLAPVPECTLRFSDIRLVTQSGREVTDKLLVE